LHIHVISSQCYMFLFVCLLPPWWWLKKAETCRRLAVLLYIFFVCYCWTKRSKVIMLHVTWMILILFMCLVGCGSNSSIHKFWVASKFVEPNPYINDISEGMSVWWHQYFWKQAGEVHPVHRSCLRLHASVGQNICFPLTYVHLIFS
jgi:hypothetical protein